MAVDIRGIAPLLEVFDMPTSIAFYRGVLGFQVGTASAPGDRFDWALLKLNDVELMPNTAYDEGERPPVPDPARIVGQGVTLYFRCPDVDAAYAHLRVQEVDVQKPITRDYGMKQLSVTDPDGYSLCFQSPVA
ncbi:MAG: VOC family protein [Acidobacteriota bacterium]